MDTGGFFVALFEKITPIRDRNKKSCSLNQDLNVNVKVEKAVSAEAKLNSTTEVMANPNDEVKSSEAEKELNIITEVMTDPNDDVKLSGAEKETIKYEKDSSEKINPKQELATATKVTKPEGEGTLKPKHRFTGRGIPKDLGNENFQPIAEDVFAPIIDYYGLKETFPRDQIMARASGDAKHLYFITNSVKRNLIDVGMQSKITVVNSGLRAFERKGNNIEGAAKYRPVQESIHYISPHMTKRKLIADFGDFTNCLGSGAIKIDTFSEDFASQILELDLGAFVVILKGYENEISKKMMLTMWRCRGETVNVLVPKKEVDGFRGKLKCGATE